MCICEEKGVGEKHSGTEGSGGEDPGRVPSELYCSKEVSLERRLLGKNTHRGGGSLPSWRMSQAEVTAEAQSFSMDGN